MYELIFLVRSYELQKVIISLVISLCLHNKFGCHWIDIRVTLHWAVLLKSVDRIQFWFKADRNNGHVTRGSNHVSESISLSAAPLTRGHWVAMGAKPFINVASNVTLWEYMHSLSCWSYIQFSIRRDPTNKPKQKPYKNICSLRTQEAKLIVWSFVLSGTYRSSAMLGTAAFIICSSWIRPTGLFDFTIMC
jgi:hypothetical protein